MKDWNWIELTGLIASLLGVLVGAVWWLSAVYHQQRQQTAFLGGIQETLTAEFGGIRNGKIVEGRQSRNHREVTERVSSLDGRLTQLEKSLT